MNGARVELTFEKDGAAYRPGEMLSGAVLIGAENSRDIRAVELSVLWSTEGKGDEDLAVHFFQRLEPAAGGVDLRQPCKFSTRLPASPLSYEGVIVKICWCVRVRVLPIRGKDLVVEKPFLLGAIPPAQWTIPQ